jgi:hypothetical protein
MSTDTREAEQRLRDAVNDPCNLSTLVQSQAWSNLCAAMDLIGDTTEALNAYPAAAQRAADNGSAYLLIYGVLQALYLQQDAVTTIRRSAGLPPDWMSPELQTIREIRNATAGHPQQRHDGRAHSIVRAFISPAGFLMYTFRQDEEEFRDEWVRLPSLISEMERGIVRALDEVSEALEARQRAQSCRCRV